MKEEEAPSVETLCLLAEQAGLPLSAEEAADLQNGVRRNKQMAQTVRKLLTPDLEPSVRFSPPSPEKG